MRRNLSTRQRVLRSRRAGSWRAASLCIILTAVCLGTVSAQRAATSRPNLPTLPELTSKDRILILAPHEDDETLGAGGLIQKAVSVGAAVRVVYLTYGDHNELAFVLYRKRPWVTAKINQQMGEVRRREAVEAMATLGVPSKNLVFLGYPDGGTLEIWKKHWGDKPPLVSKATHGTTVPYPDAFSYHRPHKGEEIVADLERQLLEFRPTHIFVTQPVDSHPDHRAYYLFLQVALHNLSGEIPRPALLTYPLHIGTWPRPYGFRPTEWLPFPKPLVDEQGAWWTLELEPHQVGRKDQAIRKYKSQTVDNLFWLEAFARRNELFHAAPEIILRQDEWSTTQGLVARSEAQADEQKAQEGHVTGVAYRSSAEGLQVRIALRRPLERELGVSVYAYGYRHDRPFGTMPKLRVIWRMERLHVTDQGVAIPKAGVLVEATGKWVLVSLPWHLLGDPEIVLVQAQGQAGGFPVSQTSWRVLRLSHE